MIRRRDVLSDPTLQLVGRDTFVRADGSVRPHDPGTLITAGATIIGANMASDAASSAAQTQAGATGAGIDEQAREFNTTQDETAPYRNAGVPAISRLSYDLGLNGSFSPAGSVSGDPEYNSGMRKFSVADFWNDPVVQLSYQSGLDLGTKALKNAAPLTTGLDSGAALKELTKFGTDYTGQQAAGSQARYVSDQTNQFNRLASLAGIGQTAVNTSTAAGTNSANNVSQMLTAQGNAQGAAQIAGANAWGGGLQSISNYWNNQQTLNKILNRGGVTGAGTSGYGYNGAAPYTNYYATD